MKCQRCGSEMKNKMHFENGKRFAYHECKSCKTQTHQKRIHFEDFDKDTINKN